MICILIIGSVEVRLIAVESCKLNCLSVLLSLFNTMYGILLCEKSIAA